MTMLNQNFSMWAGNTRYISVSVTEDDDTTPKDLTDAHILWIMREYGEEDSLLEKTTDDDGVQINDPPTDGIFTIILKPEDTVDLSGIYHHRAIVTNQHGEVSTVLMGSAIISNVLDVAPPDEEGWEEDPSNIVIVDNKIFITRLEDTEDNHNHRIRLSAGMKDMYGNALPEDIVINLTSRYYPILASFQIVLLDLQQYMTNINKDYAYRYIRENSLAIMSITPRSENWDDPPYEFKQYVRFKTVYDMVVNTYIKAIGGAGKAVSLGDLSVDKKSASADMAVILKRLEDQLQPWYDLCMQRTNRGRAKVDTVVKGGRGRGYSDVYPHRRGIDLE